MEADLDWLRTQVQQLLADALAAEQDHAAQIRRRDVQHADDIERRDRAHADRAARRDLRHAAELRSHDADHAREIAQLREAIETRDVIGQAKGVIMVTMGCTADEAFELLRAQSQAENLKLVDIAAEVARRAARRSGRAG